MADLPAATVLHRRGHGPDRQAVDRVVLTYDARLLRRRRLTTERGAGFLVDLPAVTGLDQGDRFELADGRLIEVIAAAESLIEVRGDLARMAWHIGNRHTPCQIDADRLLIREDHVLEAMLRGLGAQVARVTGPFVPEGGAYGMGRPMGHDHGPGHGPDHAHDHAHDHGHGHGPDHGHHHD
ncbi:MAG: urease accessory protein UreE [Rhodobacteraceae bacterium]|nr:urease accessory protein UreE [Paracoccaceae bacterium]